MEQSVRTDERRAHRIVVVGGGAGGLELATLLGNTLGRKGIAEITLIDCSRTHLWKPLLHRVAAGIKAPDFLAELDGLESNRPSQLLVKQTLQTTRDPEVFAFGDCSSSAWPGHEAGVPPRAQAAHQQASHLAKSLIKHIQGKLLNDWVYRDFGSLVSLGQYSTVGSLMGALTRGSLMIEGYFARLMYLSLYEMHEYTLHGFAKVFFDTLTRLIVRQTEPHVKLH